MYLPLYRSDGRLTRDFLCIGKTGDESTHQNDVELVECDTDDIWNYDARVSCGVCLLNQETLQKYIITILNLRHQVTPAGSLFNG